MYYFYDNFDLRLKGKNFGGDYDAGSSGTFMNQGYAKDDDGNIIGTNALENFQFGKKNLVAKPFQLIDINSLYKNYIGFGYPKQGSFFDVILTSLPSQSMTIAFDEYPNTGVLTLGGSDTTRCYKDWRIINLATFTGDDGKGKWGAAIDILSAGKFSAATPGNILFTVYDVPLRWPKSVYYPLINALGSNDGKTVPCSSQINIKFQIEDMTFELTPEHYLDREMEEKKGYCLLSGTTVDNGQDYILPRAILKDYCLSINHYTAEIGLATRK